MRRGDVFAFRRQGRDANGHEQLGARLAVVVGADEFRWLATVTVVPTSTSGEGASFRPRVTAGGRTTRLLVDQISTVDRSRIGRRARRPDAACCDEGQCRTDHFAPRYGVKSE